jgi:paraquat-inducible protein B
VTNSAEALQHLALNLEKTSEGGQRLLATLDAKVDPLVVSVMGSAEQMKAAAVTARGALSGVDGALGGESPLGQQLRTAIYELTGASRSIRALADYLERHPGALVWGRGR